MRTFLDKHFCEFKPDYIFLEQPWLWPLVKKKIHEEQLSTKVVYSSQNVEYITKLSILESNQVIDTCNVVQSIKELESDICANADVVIGCTQQDIDEFVKFGAKKSVLCPNGIASHVTTESSKELIKSLVGDRNYALFVGSAYPPNAQGFWTMLGNSMAWLKPNQMIVAVGGCSLILEDFAPIDSRMYDFVNFDRIKRLGFVESDELASLIEEADVLILPITSGGGSNLKTAEAIMSGKPVVATSKACRGYDITANLSDFDVCDDQQTFVSSVQKYLGSECRSVSDDEMKIRETVLWSSTLADLQKVFGQH
ncbi:glycosyltransferase [Salinivibrio sp. IB643]|uniref:glycosyltransferase n=1 Tax=Salinivibrio sp. IB643 TaxID=1909445 RepID=UPI0009899520|nr:glycosyltransferase [Salinivibrio sp. IB643]OOE95379.1 hypothetical protein BZG77_13500 [Salinivibrio sp. IB643]